MQCLCRIATAVIHAEVACTGRVLATYDCGAKVSASVVLDTARQRAFVAGLDGSLNCLQVVFACGFPWQHVPELVLTVRAQLCHALLVAPRETYDTLVMSSHNFGLLNQGGVCSFVPAVSVSCS